MRSQLGSGVAQSCSLKPNLQNIKLESACINGSLLRLPVPPRNHVFRGDHPNPGRVLDARGSKSRAHATRRFETSLRSRPRGRLGEYSM